MKHDGNIGKKGRCGVEQGNTVVDVDYNVKRMDMFGGLKILSKRNNRTYRWRVDEQGADAVGLTAEPNSGRKHCRSPQDYIHNMPWLRSNVLKTRGVTQILVSDDTIGCV